MKRFIVILTVLMYVCPEVYAEETLEITVIDVGQGDSILISFPAESNSNNDRKHMLIDGGIYRTNTSLAGVNIVEFLQKKKISKLDFVVLTHPHSDHFGGLTHLFKSKKITVDEFWWTGRERDTSGKENKGWQDFKSALVNNVSKQQVVKQNMKRTIQGAEITILNAADGDYPTLENNEHINNSSMVLLLKYKDVKVLLTGDIEKEEGKDLVMDYCNDPSKPCHFRDVDIIKMPHHGSHKLYPHFVKLVKAEHVLISAGYKNKQYHHPRYSALQAYKNANSGVKFYSTSADSINLIKVKIKPDKAAKKGKISVFGASSGFTYWRENYNNGCIETDEEDQTIYCLLHYP